MAIHQVKGHKITKKQAGKRMSIDHLDDGSFMSEVHHPAPMPSANAPFTPGPPPVRSSHPDVASLLAHVSKFYLSITLRSSFITLRVGVKTVLIYQQIKV